VLAAAPLLCLGTVGAGAATAKPTSPPCPGGATSPSAASVASVASVDATTLCLIDQVRRTYHLRPLRANNDLRTLATSQVHHMVSWNYFADNRPGGVTPISLISATAYSEHAKSLSIGQNIGWGTGDYASPASIVAAWMASPPHRKIILTGGYRDAGVGVTPALPPVLGQEQAGATYAIELGARRY
jgi:uncharacterized protein YkwD